MQVGHWTCCFFLISSNFSGILNVKFGWKMTKKKYSNCILLTLITLPIFQHPKISSTRLITIISPAVFTSIIHKLPSWNYSYIIHFSNFYLLNKVIGAATQCALSTSQLVACAKVVAPTISDPLCQEQLMEAAKDVAKSVEGCVTTCKEVSRDEPSLRELGKYIFM